MDNISKKTGLSPIQEKALSFIVGGMSKTEVCQKLEIDRSTLYLWEQNENWQAYYNRLIKEVKDRLTEGLFSLCDKALQSITDILECENYSAKFKAATWLIDRILNIEGGPTDPRFLIKSKCSKTADLEEILGINMSKYRELCKLNNLSP